MEEQELICLFFEKFRAHEDMTEVIKKIQSPKYRDSLILNYYLGVYYEKCGNVDLSKKQFEKCISLSKYFAQPYFHLAEQYIREGRIEEMKTLLNNIFNKNTLDATTINSSRRFQIMDQLRIIHIMLPHLKGYTRLKYYCEKTIEILKNERNWQYRHYEIWKLIHMTYAIETEDTNPFFALCLYNDGLSMEPSPSMILQPEESRTLSKIQQDLLLRFCVYRNYALLVPLCCTSIQTVFSKKTDNSEELFRVARSDKKIKIGYMSPDFNKNAVGLFVTPLLKYFDKNRFEVYCYYNHTFTDEFTAMFMSYPNVRWVNISSMADEEAYYLIKYQDEIDVLFDLIGLGVKNRIGLMSLKPAPVTINYLGYPDYTHLPAITYRMVDNITDPDTETHRTGIEQFYKGMDYKETLLRLPRCFVCYHLFENTILPSIRSSPRFPNEIRCAVMNKKEKCNKVILDIWKTIMRKNEHITLYLKFGENNSMIHDTLLDGFPKDRLRFIPFFEDLNLYLDYYNEIDLCFDSYPYNGTTTTCSSLIMGVPVISMYRPDDRHVSNVTGSILKHCGESNYFMVDSYDKYIENVSIFSRESLDQRRERRERFIKTMNPIDFMKDFEKIIEDVVRKT